MDELKPKKNSSKVKTTKYQSYEQFQDEQVSLIDTKENQMLSSDFDRLTQLTRDGSSPLKNRDFANEEQESKWHEDGFRLG